MLHCYTDSIDMVIIKALYSQEHCTYMFIQDGKYTTLYIIISKVTENVHYFV